jgi:N-acetylneuraminic acid mutarotase
MPDIYAFGGYESGVRAQASVFKFDTEANEWSTLAPMPVASASHSASVLDGLVYIVGAGNSRREVLRFDLASGAWSTLASTSISRLCGASFVLDGCLYAVGGTENGASMERYDPATDTWAHVANMLEGRQHFKVVTAVGSATRPSPAEEQDLFDSLIARASSD